MEYKEKDKIDINVQNTVDIVNDVENNESVRRLNRRHIQLYR